MSIQMPNIPIQAFDYPLPESKIAQFPLANRHDSKLLVYQDGIIKHEAFRQLAHQLPENALLIFNNTKVIPARIHFQKPTGATIQIFLLHPIAPTAVINLAMEVSDSCIWECMIGNKKRFKKNDILQRTLQVNGNEVVVSAKLADEEQNHVELSWQNLSNDAPILFVDLIQSLGEIPLPPYLNRETESSDYETYQTVYSEKKGAVAAPTAGLHFTERVLQKLQEAGFKQDFLTLHVGAGTFMPVKSESIQEHTMHAERYWVPLETQQAITDCKAKGGRVVAVGTTTVRTLESWAQSGQDSGDTQIFITPGFDFKIVDVLITNFHLPKSTLLMLVSAFTGYEKMMALYLHAISQQYRFFSYGDAMILKRQPLE